MLQGANLGEMSFGQLTFGRSSQHGVTKISEQFDKVRQWIKYIMNALTYSITNFFSKRHLHWQSLLLNCSQNQGNKVSTVANHGLALGQVAQGGQGMRSLL
jgi:hypothetical protein